VNGVTVNMNPIKKILGLILLVGFALYGYNENARYVPNPDNNRQTTTTQSLQYAYDNRLSDIQVSGNGTVLRLLADDNKGSRHQKFLVKVSNAQTLLIAHNIDLAPRIDSLRKGDILEFFGEYEWNPKGGVIHWTHHDPNGRHINGWLKHHGRTYQ
jgi:hypothetical protein